jgi:hypothetical protein
MHHVGSGAHVALPPVVRGWRSRLAAQAVASGRLRRRWAEASDGASSRRRLCRSRTLDRQLCGDDGSGSRGACDEEVASKCRDPVGEAAQP